MTEQGYYNVRWEKVLLPTVRIQAPHAGGSGSVVYSRDGATYILTNHHVVEGAIKAVDKWSPLLKRDVKDDEFTTIIVNFFEYMWKSRFAGVSSTQADIVTYDKNEDLALLKVRADRQATTCTLYPRGKEADLRATMPVFAVGAGMSEGPVITQGMLSQFGQEIANREFWLNTAPIIFGNSGGSLFLADTLELIGVPTRMVVKRDTGDAITHLAFNIPINRIYDFFEAQRFRFIYDTSFTEEGEAAERDRMRKESQLEIAVKDSEMRRKS